MGFYVDISWESSCNIEINVWAHFYKVVLVLRNWPQIKGMPGKSKNYQKLVRDASNFFIVHKLIKSFVWNKKDIKKIQKFYKISLDFDFTVVSWILGKVHVKPYFSTQCPPPQFSDLPTALRKRGLGGNDWHCIIQMCSVYVVPHPIYLMQPKSSANRVY